MAAVVMAHGMAHVAVGASDIGLCGDVGEIVSDDGTAPTCPVCVATLKRRQLPDDQK